MFPEYHTVRNLSEGNVLGCTKDMAGCVLTSGKDNVTRLDILDRIIYRLPHLGLLGNGSILDNREVTPRSDRGYCYPDTQEWPCRGLCKEHFCRSKLTAEKNRWWGCGQEKGLNTASKTVGARVCIVVPREAGEEWEEDERSATNELRSEITWIG